VKTSSLRDGVPEPEVSALHCGDKEPGSAPAARPVSERAAALHDRCGGRGKAKAVSGKKRGRVSATRIVGVNVDTEMRCLFRDTVTRCFAVNRRLDMAGCYDMLNHDHFAGSQWMPRHPPDASGNDVPARCRASAARFLQRWG